MSPPQSPEPLNNPNFKNSLKKLTLARSALKRRITRLLTKLKSNTIEDGQSPTDPNSDIILIKSLLAEVNNKDEQINELYGMEEMDESPAYDAELSAQTDYASLTHSELFKLSNNLTGTLPTSKNKNNSGCDHGVQHVNLNEIKPPPLQCGTFEGSNHDKLGFKNFLAQFNNIIDSKLSLTPASKLTYLKGYLKGYAFKTIKHLSISDANYPIALDLLKKEFLDIPFIVDETLKQIFALSPAYDAGFKTSSSYLNEIRSLVYELKEYGYDYLEAKSAGNVMLSHKVCCPKWDDVKNSFFPRHCGYNPKFVKKIVGGNETEMGEFPWAVALEYEKDGKKSFRCSGTVINSRYVLTAGHCVDENFLQGYNMKFISVRLGDWDLSQEKDCIITNTAELLKCAPNYIEAKPENIIIHPMFNKVLSDDIALIRLDKTIDFEESEGYIQPICLPSYGVNPRLLANGRHLTVIGWGMADTGQNSPILRKARVPVINRNKCVSHYSTLFGSRQLCVGGTMADSCQGDSGGPLLLEGPRGPPYLQIGITSFGSAICGSRTPAVYTYVTKYMTWIRTNMEPWQI